MRHKIKYYVLCRMLLIALQDYKCNILFLTENKVFIPGHSDVFRLGYLHIKHGLAIKTCNSS